MDFESWWLVIIPILFGLGWIAGRFDMRQIVSETRQLPDSYFKGLNFLLNEDHDQAIDAFVEVAKLDTETTELHFALGSLFRRRGEIERAIRVHQSLLNRADLAAQDQAQARYELAQDFFKAGMFLINILIICSEASKSAITPSFKGRMVFIFSCVLPCIKLAS